MNKKAVAALLLLVLVGTFLVIACSKSPSKDKGEKAQSMQTVTATVPPPATEPPAPTCSDRIKNGQETGVDCGGPTCRACA